jgi:hypothetical protein
MTAYAKPLAQEAMRGNFVLLSVDSVHLLLPQHEVGAVEYLDGPLIDSRQLGLLKFQNVQSPRRFAVLSRQMTLLSHCPPERFLLTPLGDENPDLRWCWDEVRVLFDVALQSRPLPAVLLAPATPVERYVEFGGKICFMCSARQLYSFVFASRS